MALGLVHGIATSASVVVFLSILGIVPQLAVVTNTTRQRNVYGLALGLGAVTFAMADLLDFRLSLGAFRLPAMAFVLLLWGLFTGILLSALAEVFDIFPAFTGKLGIRDGLKILILALALGKMAGAAVSLFTPYFPS